MKIVEEKFIPGYEGCYMATSMGDIISCRISKQTGRVMRKVLKTNTDRKGYLHINLYINGKRKEHTVHRLIAKTFLLPVKDMLEINHKDGIKTNNSVENLERCNHSWNIKHAYKIGLRIAGNQGFKGSKNVMAKLTEEDVLRIRNIYKRSFSTHKEIGKRFGVTRSLIGFIVNRKIWTHI